MVIRLVNADFSAKNIGTINISNELSSDTVAILSKFTRVISNDQKFAFENLLHGLKEEGIWNGIKFMYIPLLCGKLSEIGMNVKTLESDITVSDNYYELSEDNGIKAKTAGINVPQASRMKILFNGSQMNYHFMYMPMGLYSVDGTTTEGLLRFETSNAQMMIQQVTATKGIQSSIVGRCNGNKAFSTKNYLTYESQARNVDLIGLSFGTDGITSYGYGADGKLAIIQTVYPSEVLDDTYFNEVTYLLNSNSYGISNSYGLMSIGLDLSDAQLKKYYELASAFKSAMLV